jgi:hypothetical protein
MPKTFFSDNDTGTMADNLKALGLAEVLFTCTLQLGGREADTPTIRDCGGYFAIELASPIEPEDVVRLSPTVIGRGKRFAKGEGEGFPYEQERQRRDEYFKKRSKLSAEERKRYEQHPEEFPELQDLEPHPLLPHYISVSHFRTADAYNALLEQWEGGNGAGYRGSDSDWIDDELEQREGDREAGYHHNLRVLLETFSHHPNDLVAAEKAWSTGARNAGRSSSTLLQVVNPSSGKGGNAPKANNSAAGNLGGFWMIEFLKFVGYFTIAAPVLLGDDRKTYVLHPTMVRLDMLHRLMDGFRKTFFASTAVKTDILASLRFTQTFIRYCGDMLRASTTANPLLALFHRMPTVTDISSGFDVAFYKSMGNAFATMNQATINLPDWLAPIEREEQAQQAGASLEEHVKVILSIRTSKGDEAAEEYDLLRCYRDFLSGHDVLRFIEFAAYFGDYYLSRRHRGQWMAQFTTEGMEHLMAQSKSPIKLSEILSNKGFQEVAAAIRLSTVIAQYRAAREKGSYPYDVRYGLGQDLLRAAAYPEGFAGALSVFIQSYNAENARIDERIVKGSLHAPRRPSVRTDALDEIAELVDRFGSEVVCKLLVAYGYARDPRVQEADMASQADGDEITQTASVQR